MTEKTFFLAEWMRVLGWSDAKLAEALDTDRETVNRWRNYPQRLNPMKIVRIARVLGIDPGDLFSAPGERKNARHGRAQVGRDADPEPGR